jgi:hypothetical protein
MMNFRNEKISDEDREKFAVNQSVNRWTFDEETSTFLVGLGVNQEHYANFFFHFKGENISFGAYQSSKGNSKNGIAISYSIEELTIPSNLSNQDSTIKEMIKKALKVYQDSGRALPNCEVLVNIK